MKLFIIYLYNPDTNVRDQFFGVFESKKRLKEEMKNLSKELKYEIPNDDFEIIETELNKNWLTAGQIVKIT